MSTSSPHLSDKWEAVNMDGPHLSNTVSDRGMSVRQGEAGKRKITKASQIQKPPVHLTSSPLEHCESQVNWSVIFPLAPPGVPSFFPHLTQSLTSLPISHLFTRSHSRLYCILLLPQLKLCTYVQKPEVPVGQ